MIKIIPNHLAFIILKTKNFYRKNAFVLLTKEERLEQKVAKKF